MRNIPTFVLKVALAILFIPVILYIGALFIEAIPSLSEVFQDNRSLAIYIIIVIAIVGVTAFPYTYIIYQAWNLLVYIDTNEAFSLKSVIALRKIKYLAIVIGIFYCVSLPFVYLIANITNALGLIFVNLVIGFAALVVAVFTMIIQKLLYEAILIKEENDLTV